MTDIITYIIGCIIAVGGAASMYDDATNYDKIVATDAALHFGETWFGGTLVLCAQDDMNIVSAVPEAIECMVLLPYNIAKEVCNK